MHHIIAAISAVLASVAFYAEAPAYRSDVSTWEESAPPADAGETAQRAWFQQATNSGYGWRVLAKDGKTHAQVEEQPAKPRGQQPPFTPKADRFYGGNGFAVDDGWLIGFNMGEWGAALYWFSPDGSTSYKISDHQVVDFFVLPDGIHAIEGLAHMFTSRGSVIRIARPAAGGKWAAVQVQALPFAPRAVSVTGAGGALITLTDAVVLYQPGKDLQMPMPVAPFGRFISSSSVLSADGQKLYIGMRQFVGEFDLATKKLRLLVPSQDFLKPRPRADAPRH